MQGTENVGALASPGETRQRKTMTTRLPLTTPTLPDTFEARWDGWVAKGIRQDEIARKRARGTLVVLASTIAIAAVWLLFVQ
jgi:hypothetical protein